MLNKFFVKFVPWNERTLSSLIDKTIKFSTVLEFNDFNEYRYHTPYTLQKQSNLDEKTKEILKQGLNKLVFKQNLKKLAKERYSSEHCDKIWNFLKSGATDKLLDPEEDCLRTLIENLAFSSVGIFCMSAISVFDDDSAQLMFAHYSENISGLALIYEAGSSNKGVIHQVKYDSSSKHSFGEPKRIIDWYEIYEAGFSNKDEMRHYKDIGDFLWKSKKWDYEMEKRMFSNPGIHEADLHGTKLRAILYTPRFKGKKETLDNINNCHYNNNLIIEKIYASPTGHYFKIKEGNSKVIPFLKKRLGLSQDIDITIRPSISNDIKTLVLLSYAKRREYEKAQPQFWRYAGIQAEKSQAKWFGKLLEHKDYIMLTAEAEGKIVGFIIGKLTTAPEVYNPGGLTLMIDDFCVKNEELWESVGAKLIAEIKATAKSKDAVQILVVAGHHDNAKLNFLKSQGLTVASEWFVGGSV